MRHLYWGKRWTLQALRCFLDNAGGSLMIRKRFIPNNLTLAVPCPPCWGHCWPRWKCFQPQDSSPSITQVTRVRSECQWTDMQGFRDFCQVTMSFHPKGMLCACWRTPIPYAQISFRRWSWGSLQKLQLAPEFQSRKYIMLGWGEKNFFYTRLHS